MYLDRIQTCINRPTFRQKALSQNIVLGRDNNLNNYLIQLLKELNFKEENAQIIINKIKKAYSNNRIYHNLEHIKSMLISFEEFMNCSIESEKIKSPSEFMFAILMHDYINGVPGEVEKSSEVAKKFWETNTKKDFSYIRGLILATDYSKSNNKSFDEKLIQDLDLKILGENSKKYEYYSNTIREEYSRFSDDLFKPARIKVLNSFLDKEHIYNTTFFRDNYEKQARINLKNEIEYLSN